MTRVNIYASECYVASLSFQSLLAYVGATAKIVNPCVNFDEC
jgi:hypothetical protein